MQVTTFFIVLLATMVHNPTEGCRMNLDPTGVYRRSRFMDSSDPRGHYDQPVGYYDQPDLRTLGADVRQLLQDLGQLLNQ